MIGPIAQAGTITLYAGVSVGEKRTNVVRCQETVVVNRAGRVCVFERVIVVVVVCNPIRKTTSYQSFVAVVAVGVIL
jgi:hypothetical protein